MSEQAIINPQSTGNMRWYVIHAYSGMEKSVQKGLTERIARSGMADKFGKILVPSEEVVEIKSGQKAVSERRFFPGYVLIEMEMTDETWHLVKNTPKVTVSLAALEINHHRFLLQKFKKSWTKCRLVLISQNQKHCLRWVKWFALKKAHSQTSMATLKKLTMRSLA